MSGLILAIDQGTHSTRAIVFDPQGRQVALARRPVSLQRHSRTEVEQSPGEILQSMQAVVTEVLQHPDLAGRQVRAAGMATQRSSVLAWSRDSGEALSPLLSWQDTRTAAALQSLAAFDTEIRALTGLPLSPHYGAGKLQWLLSNEEGIRAAHAEQSLVLGPLAAYLLHHLSGGAQQRIDHANASRTLLWDLQSRDWSARMLELFAIPREVLPLCQPVCSDYGRTQNGSIPVTAVNGDQTAALYAQGTPSKTTIRVNIGTGAFVLLPVDDPDVRPHGLLAGISQSDANSAAYYIEGTVNGGAAALKWAAREYGINDLKTRLPDWLASISDPPLFINSVGGLGAPWWKPGPQPGFAGDAPPPEVAAVAVIESILFLVQANIDLMQTLHPDVERIQVSGGLSNLDGLCRRLANLSGLPVHRPVQVEATARGIAWQAAGCPEDWPASGPGETFEATPDPAFERRYHRFMQILESSP